MNAVLKCLSSVLQFINGLDIGIKIRIGTILFMLACLMTIITYGATFQALTIMVKMSVMLLVGVVSSVIVAATAATNGGDIAESVSNAVADAVFWGDIFEFIVSGINAVKAPKYVERFQ